MDIRDYAHRDAYREATGHDAWERTPLPDALASDEQPITSPEICVCGDYRSDHVDGTGRCRMPNDITHGFESCLEFRSAGEYCPLSQRVDGRSHTWEFDGDDPYVICAWCKEIRDALTGRLLRKGLG